MYKIKEFILQEIDNLDRQISVIKCEIVVKRLETTKKELLDLLSYIKNIKKK